MVTKGVQGIAITPVDPTVATTLDKAVAKGVKVVLMDNKIPNWKGQTALATTKRLAPRIPAGRIAVSESGIFTTADLDALATVGVRTFLVGESLMRQADVAAATRALLGRPQRLAGAAE